MALSQPASMLKNSMMQFLLFLLVVILIIQREQESLPPTATIRQVGSFPKKKKATGRKGRASAS